MNDQLTMYRVGDFYALYGKDAEIVAKVLQLTLMYQNRKSGELAMCGFPHHSLEGHLRILLNKKYKVAIADGAQRKEAE